MEAICSNVRHGGNDALCEPIDAQSVCGARLRRSSEDGAEMEYWLKMYEIEADRLTGDCNVSILPGGEKPHLVAVNATNEAITCHCLRPG